MKPARGPQTPECRRPTLPRADIMHLISDQNIMWREDLPALNSFGKVGSYLFLFLVLTTISVTGTPADDQEEPEFTPAKTVVKRLQHGLIETMKVGPEIGYDGRFDRITPLVLQTHQLSAMARLTVGRRTWMELSDEDKKGFVRRFARIVVSSYASHFKKYGGEAFEWIREQVRRPGQMAVFTEFQKANGEIIPFIYILSDSGGDWRIINITAKGISDLALKRAEYTSIIKRHGFPALLKKLDEKVTETREKHVTEQT